MTTPLIIQVPRNGVYQEDWYITARGADKIERPVDLTEHSFALAISYAAGIDVLYDAETFIYPDVEGRVRITIDGRAILDDAISPMQIVPLAFDLKHTDQYGIPRVYPRGSVFLIPGVTP